MCACVLACVSSCVPAFVCVWGSVSVSGWHCAVLPSVAFLVGDRRGRCYEHWVGGEVMVVLGEG